MSFGRAILTLEEADEKEIDETRPVSIFSIAKFYKLSDVFISDSSVSGLIDCVKSAEKLGVNLHFGFKVICCADITDKSENSFKTEHKIIVWLNDSAGYSNFVKIISAAQTDGFYYIPRIDGKTLKKFWSESLSISIPMYDSFIQKNVLEFGQCVPDFPCKPVLFYENNNLPFDEILQEKVLEYAEKENLEVVKTQSIFYYKYSDFKAFLVNKCVNNRSTLEKPEFRHLSSDTFCFEHYLKTIKQPL